MGVDESQSVGPQSIRHAGSNQSFSQPPSGWLATATCVLALFVVVGAQFFIAQTSIFSLGFALPLLVCLWARNRGLLVGLALLITGLMFIKTVLILGNPGAPPPTHSSHLGEWLIQAFNLWVTTLAIYLAIMAMDRSLAKSRQLSDANQNLEASNQQLAAREGVVSRQNSDLHDQAGKLHTQSEVLHRQTDELQSVNEELMRRERGLQTLLESARWLRSDLSEQDVMSSICHAAVQVTRDGVSAAAVVHERDAKLTLRGHYGFGMHGTLLEQPPFRESFAAQVMARGQTLFINDLSTRPNVKVAQPAAGKPFRSVLSTPLTIDGRTIGAVEVYASQPREWTDAELRVIEWLSVQCALALQAIEYQQEVVVKRREAEEASRQKTRFLAAVSHDVRTPANAISLLADLIERAGESPDSAERADIPTLARDLKINARALVELVSDVLDLSRMDAGKHDLQTDEFRLCALLETLIRQVEPIAAEKKLRLSLKPAAGDPFVRTDKMKLARVLSNLIGNALKFTEAGAVEVSCEPAPEGGLAILIADTGVGIPAEALPRIFDEFFQLQNTERDRNKGSGLGLAICRRLVDALGCTMQVHSDVGVGTTFTIFLQPQMMIDGKSPSVADARKAGNGHPAADQDAFLQHKKILLVEDHEVTRRAAGRLLASRGATVLEAGSGREAIHMLVHEQPDILLLDLMLPDADGTDILRYLRSRRPASLKCVLAVSGDVRDARVQEVRELGADDLLPKPLNIEKLLESIAECLQRHDGLPVTTG